MAVVKANNDERSPQDGFRPKLLPSLKKITELVVRKNIKVVPADVTEYIEEAPPLAVQDEIHNRDSRFLARLFVLRRRDPVKRSILVRLFMFVLRLLGLIAPAAPVQKKTENVMALQEPVEKPKGKKKASFLPEPVQRVLKIAGAVGAGIACLATVLFLGYVYLRWGPSGVLALLSCLLCLVFLFGGGGITAMYLRWRKKQEEDDEEGE